MMRGLGFRQSECEGCCPAVEPGDERAKEPPDSVNLGVPASLGGLLAGLSGRRGLK